MENDPILEQHARRPTALNVKVPAWIVDDLDTVIYLEKRKGNKVTRSELVAAVLTAFLKGNNVQAREIREFKSRVDGAKA